MVAGVLSGVGFIVPAILFFVMVVIIPALSMIIIRLTLTKHFCSVVTIENSEAFDHATQSAEQGPQHGEGFADALDVGAI